MVNKTSWFKLMCKNNEVQLLGTLNGGQNFRWNKSMDHGKELWTGVFAGRVWRLKQEVNSISYQVHESKGSGVKDEVFYNNLISNYLQLELKLDEYYKQWSENDKHFESAAKQFYGIRILKQDVVENIFSFICSSNNHISRISSMVEKLATFYGNKICELDGVIYYSFPGVDKLAEKGVEEKLKSNGFGYRAKYISRSAQYIVDNGAQGWIERLKGMKYEEAKKTLMLLIGIGAKVADCICLMSLGHLQAIPVDTHVYQIAKRLYMPKLANKKTVTDRIYNEIGEHFRQLYGPLAGWAHTVLFCADLKKFQDNNMEKTDTNPSVKKKVKSK